MIVQLAETCLTSFRNFLSDRKSVVHPQKELSTLNWYDGTDCIKGGAKIHQENPFIGAKPSISRC